MITPDGPARIFIVDDHAMMRTVLSEFLEQIPEFEVCGVAASAEEALMKLPVTECQIALVDVSMPGMSGIELVSLLQERKPGLRCLILSGHAQEVYVKGAMEAGAWGYVTKSNPDALANAIRQVLRGEKYMAASP